MVEFFVKNIVPDVEERKLARVSPLFNEDFTRIPKVLIVAAQLDPLIDQIKLYAQKLVENGNKCEMKIVAGTIHGFFHNGFYFKNAFGEAVQHILEYFNQI